MGQINDFFVSDQCEIGLLWFFVWKKTTLVTQNTKIVGFFIEGVSHTQNHTSFSVPVIINMLY